VTRSAARVTSPAGAMRLAHGHQNQHPPLGSGATSTWSFSAVTCGVGVLHEEGRAPAARVEQLGDPPAAGQFLAQLIKVRYGVVVAGAAHSVHSSRGWA